MEDKYKNKYRIKSTRLSGWDYGSHGLYFVTICTKDRNQYFGEIVETNDDLSLQSAPIGKIAHDYWLAICEHFPFVELDEFIIMPDHLHGILFINKPEKITREANKFGSQSRNLASIVRGFKTSVKRYANLNGIDFEWQSGYYDRVVRDESEYQNIRQYIYDNPQKWVLNNGADNDISFISSRDRWLSVSE